MISALNCEWTVAESDRAAVHLLAQTLDVHPIIAHLLIIRGATTPDAARLFLNPSATQFSDPYELTDMDVAVAHLQQAKTAGKHVLVFGDYDVDGIAGAAILIRAFQRYGIANCSYGMPNRQLEGYGLSPERVRKAHADGVQLIVTVDNGIAAREAAREAQDCGIDLIVTDHHRIEGPLPPAVAVINPQRENADYAGRHLCGAGVAFKLAHALTGEMHDLDLAALGTVADMVPLSGENRAIVALGLQHLREHPRPGIHALAEVAGIQVRDLCAEDVGYQIAPRINAGGRLGDGLDGLHLLLTDDPQRAHELAEELNEANLRRREIEHETLTQAMALLATTFKPEHRSIVLASDTWHRGVIGIVASRIQSHFYRPVILIALDPADGIGRGSARSIAGFNIAEALTACESHLIAYGGHAAAAGLTIAADRLETFRAHFETEVADRLPQGELRKRIAIDAQIALSEIDDRLVRSLGQLEPFGQSNPSPLFCTYGATVLPNSWRELKGAHMKLALRDGQKLMQAIGFRMAVPCRGLFPCTNVDAVFSPQFNTWRGETSIQLTLKDLRTCNP